MNPQRKEGNTKYEDIPRYVSLLLTYQPGKRCIGYRIRIEHHFLANPNASPSQKYAEHLGYCPVCWISIPRSTSVQAPGWYEKKYQTRNDRYDIAPSTDYN